MKHNVKWFKMKKLMFIFEIIAISLNSNLLLITDLRTILHTRVLHQLNQSHIKG